MSFTMTLRAQFKRHKDKDPEFLASLDISTWLTFTNKYLEECGSIILGTYLPRCRSRKYRMHDITTTVPSSYSSRAKFRTLTLDSILYSYLVSPKDVLGN